ncbi:MAG: Hpt domain-containing protein [Gammaproteobacteria bacterium]
MAKDPYRYFRVEARDLLEGLSQGVLELEKGLPPKKLVGPLLRLAHTLKGAARVVKQSEIAQLAHTVEEVFAPFRDGEASMLKDRIGELFRLLDAIGDRLKAIGPAPEPKPEFPTRPAVEEAFHSVRVDIEDIDDLLDGMAEASVSLDALRRGVTPMDEALGMVRTLDQVLSACRNGEPNGLGAALVRARSLTERLKTSCGQTRRALASGLERVERELEHARARARELRLVPVNTVFASLERTARDAAESLEKRVRFEAAGGETHLDAHMLGALRDALIHIVRNAVAHGIESEADRIAAGKSPVGLVQLHVERRGDRVAFLCRDDGRGFDLDAIRQAAVRRGLIAPERAAALSLEEATQLIFQGD